MKIVAQAALFFLVMTALTGILYPALITGISRVVWPDKSLGSLVKSNENIMGSALIAQKFSAPEYFWPRPSASDFSAYPSGASNLGPTSTILKDLIHERRERLSKAHKTSIKAVPESLITSSGSGLDPHISLSALKFQFERIVQARKLNQAQKKELLALINKNLLNPWLSAQKEPYINVLLLNLAVDQSFGKMGR